MDQVERAVDQMQQPGRPGEVEVFQPPTQSGVSSRSGRPREDRAERAGSPPFSLVWQQPLGQPKECPGRPASILIVADFKHVVGRCTVQPADCEVGLMPESP